jgi:hypothetical protein
MKGLFSGFPEIKYEGLDSKERPASGYLGPGQATRWTASSRRVTLPGEQAWEKLLNTLGNSVYPPAAKEWLESVVNTYA